MSREKGEGRVNIGHKQKSRVKLSLAWERKFEYRTGGPNATIVTLEGWEKDLIGGGGLRNWDASSHGF